MELVFGGTFDPPTHAHIALPRAVADHVGADLVRYVPAAVSPHKTDSPPRSAHHRVAMLTLALDGADGGLIDLIELCREGPSYTIDTLEHLARTKPAQRRLLIGSDQAEVFHRWHRYLDIESLAEPLVMLRDDADADTVLNAIEIGQGAEAVGRWRSRLLELDHFADASSAVRTDGRLEMVAPSVADYIQRHELYEVLT
jgi:nicotinate-nucleotide adenylyltransferase